MVSVRGTSRFRFIYQHVNRNRWEGTFPTNTGKLGCANGTGCSCTDANADGSNYSDVYKLFLADFFIAQVFHPSHKFQLINRQPVLNAPGDGSIGRAAFSKRSD